MKKLISFVISAAISLSVQTTLPVASYADEPTPPATVTTPDSEKTDTSTEDSRGELNATQSQSQEGVNVCDDTIGGRGDHT